MNYNVKPVTYPSALHAALELGLGQHRVLAAVGLPCYFSPVAGPVVRAAEARDNPLPWKTAMNVSTSSVFF